MGNREQKNIFYFLDQQGAFATGEQTPDLALLSREARTWSRKIVENGLATTYRIVRNQLFDFLNVNSFPEIRKLLADEGLRRQANARAYALLGSMFGIEGTEREIVSKVNSYSRIADGVIRYLKGNVFARYAPYIEMTNEIDVISSPVELFLIIFDDRYHKKARFEARRKLILMSLAGSIDQRERETDIENKFAEFLSFLNRHVWSDRQRIGELEIAYLVSEHDQETFSCREVRVVTPEQLPMITRQPGRKITLIKRRRFSADGRDIPIYVSVRKKPPEAKVLKLLRKWVENPAVAVDDELGLMGVVESVTDVQRFQKHLTNSAIRAGSFMALEDVSDTLTSGEYRSANIGSSEHTPMFKFFARMGGMRVEFIVHTHRSYLDYIYRRGASHDEYEVRRIFDSGIADLLFPEDIYHLDMKVAREELIRWFRGRIEDI